MTTKRELVKLLKAVKKEPRALTPAECDELILLLGGTTRPPHRPKSARKPMDWAAIGDVVFSFLENSETLAQLEKDLAEMDSPGFLVKAFPNLSVINRAEAERQLAEALTTGRPNLVSRIESLRPKAAKNRTQAESMAVDWFAARWVKRRGRAMDKKAIENTLTAIKEAAGLKHLGLAEWRVIKAEAVSYGEKRIAHTLEEKREI